MSKISNHQKAGGSITTKACELYQTLWSVGAYTASDNALRVRGYGHAKLGLPHDATSVCIVYTCMHIHTKQDH